MAIYMKYGSIKGKVTTEGFTDYIELSSFQWGVGRGVGSPTSSSQDRESSEPSVSEVTITKVQDAVTGDILKEALGGDGNAKVIIAFTRTKKGGGGAEKYLEVDLDKVIVSGYSFSSGGDRPTESLSLNFVTCEVHVIPMKDDGEAGDKAVVKYNLATHKMS